MTQATTILTRAALKDLLKKLSEIPLTLDFDVFGRIYEYFLGEFAMTQGQGGGEFYTPSPIVKLLTEVIEPYHGRILDPACGSNLRCASDVHGPQLPVLCQPKKHPNGV